MPDKFWIGASPDEARGPYSGVIAGSNIIADDLLVPPSKGERLVVDLHGEAEAWFTVIAVVPVRESADSRYFQLRIKAITPDRAGEGVGAAEDNPAFALGSRIADKAGFSLSGLMGEFSPTAPTQPAAVQNAELRVALRELEQRIRQCPAVGPERQQALDSLAVLLRNPIVVGILCSEEN